MDIKALHKIQDTAPEKARIASFKTAGIEWFVYKQDDELLHVKDKSGKRIRTFRKADVLKIAKIKYADASSIEKTLSKTVYESICVVVASELKEKYGKGKINHTVIHDTAQRYYYVDKRIEQYLEATHNTTKEHEDLQLFVKDIEAQL